MTDTPTPGQRARVTIEGEVGCVSHSGAYYLRTDYGIVIIPSGIPYELLPDPIPDDAIGMTESGYVALRKDGDWVYATKRILALPSGTVRVIGRTVDQ